MSELTVGDLVAMRQLGCQTIAGAGGLDRTVVWAHSCELDDPWNWLSTDELLMTTGICVPADEENQVNLVRQLARAGIAGIAVGDDMKAPPLTPAMLAEADTLGFPVLTVSHSTPFSALGRTVAVASQSEQISRIARLSRLYEAARSATLAESSLLERLSSELGYELHVVDVEYGTEVLGGEVRIDRETIRELCHRLGGRLDRLPARAAVSVGETLAATAFSLPTHRKCMLVAVGTSDVDLDAFGVLHAQSLVGIEVERATRQRERDDDLGGALFQQIIDGTLGADAAQPRLEQSGLADQEWVVIGFDATHQRAARIVLGDDEVANLSCLVGEEGYLLLAAENMDAVVALLGPHIPHLGLSATTSTVQRLPDSVRQARWALQAARADGSAVAEYSTAAPLFLPRTLSEAHFAARAVLGELMDYDEAHQSQLIETLDAFLSLDRSWSATAEKLMIHRQTLAYRLKKIEAITGRSTKSSADIASFWMALIARRISRGGLE
ncbi:PucR family transcriptional regulator [Rhodococcus opacus]|uniref:PucR family transcriptional regulator n=1 Tax=Rhodococcus opacus TaxID=37919 RepID=UPI001C44D37A|nr:PucR family transcriptional regulator [Rhodococcus opacus]MBV6754853.1 PucR family transcriptional regulator ligand-binding domain-containing protein [Rhodococcus opacus]